jgi:hypothetical protein
MEFQERYKIDNVIFDSTGSTAENISPWYDMKGYSRADFIINGVVLGTTGGPSSLAQSYTARVLCASDCSGGGGSSGISSATAQAGKFTATGITATCGADEIWLRFSTFHGKATVFTLNVGTAAFVTSSAASVAMAFAGLASDQATVASEGFIAMFNNAAANTSTALTGVWVAGQPSSVAKAADPVVRIRKKDVNSTAKLTANMAAGSSWVNIGMPALMHLGIGEKNMPTGKRYIACGVKSTHSTQPYSAVLFREYSQSPVSNFSVQRSKSLSDSTAA